MKTLHDALKLAYSMHEGVEDWTGLPYITHPVWVMLSLPAECTDEDRQIALLHDVFEDCQERLCQEFGVPWVSRKDIGMLNSLFLAFRAVGYSEYVETGLRYLTRDMHPDLTYINYVRNIANSGRRGVMWVKYYDNCHNMIHRGLNVFHRKERQFIWKCSLGMNEAKLFCALRSVFNKKP